MLVSVQRFAVDAFSMERTVWALYGRGLWIHILHQRGMGSDENLVPGLGYGRPTETRNVLGFTLTGRSFIRHGEGTLVERVAGDTLSAPGRAAFRSGMHAKSDVSFSMNIEVDRLMHDERAASVAFGRLSSGVLTATRHLTTALTAAIEVAWSTVGAQSMLRVALSRLFAHLRREGFSLPDPSAVQFQEDPARLRQLQTVGRSVDIAVSQIGTRPMLIDVEGSLAISARTIQRAFPALCAVWGQQAESFGPYSRRIRLARACSAMTSAGATTEAISRIIGFASPNAFCRAMAVAGLPSPGDVRARANAIT